MNLTLVRFQNIEEESACCAAADGWAVRGAGNQRLTSIHPMQRRGDWRSAEHHPPSGRLCAWLPCSKLRFATSAARAAAPVLAGAARPVTSRRVSSIARLKVVIDEVEPKVTRRLEVPVSMRLSRLHTVLQIVLGWTDSHLYEFSFRGIGYGIPDPDWDHRCIDARSTSLHRAIKDSGALSFKYLYDFGDGWTHSIKIEKIEPAFPGLDYPFLIHASGRCPPEDVGGPYGYAAFLEILNDPKHPRYEQTLVWPGGSFDPQFVDIAAIDRKLRDLKRRSRKTGSK